MRVLLDSVILIDHLNGIEQATSFLHDVWNDAAVSVITRAEVLTGVDDADAAPVVALLDRLPTLTLDRKTADLAAGLRRNHRWKLPDAFQAACALQHGLTLATRNTHDFPPDRFDFVAVPYSV
jgi:predicted nucleic acid-binding protein